MAVRPPLKPPVAAAVLIPAGLFAVQPVAGNANANAQMPALPVQAKLRAALAHVHFDIPLAQAATDRHPVMVQIPAQSQGAAGRMATTQTEPQQVAAQPRGFNRVRGFKAH